MRLPVAVGGERQALDGVDGHVRVVEVVIGVGIGEYFGGFVLGLRGGDQIDAGGRRRPVVGSADEDQQGKPRAPTAGLQRRPAAGIEGNGAREIRAPVRLRRVVSRLDRIQRRRTAVRPADERNLLGVDIRAPDQEV